ncbi:uncharacterized mitochondrial protein AtMg00860-like [Solanum lycopersicum]|uniref:uncharacterized mitochondrial protein AtMg00860-like n=1 Tax=Solanum lycopersicum TaxID=4081 RepID=UPI003747B2B8
MEMLVKPAGLTDGEVRICLGIDATCQHGSFQANGTCPSSEKKSRKRKHTRAGNRSRQDKENFPRKSKNEIIDKPRSVTFLGHLVSDKGVEVDHRKTEAVKNWPKPLTPTDIRSFLGLAGYYCRFVEGFSFIAASLTTLTKKKDKFEWTEACEKSFQELKDRLTSASMLILPKCD